MSDPTNSGSEWTVRSDSRPGTIVQVMGRLSSEGLVLLAADLLSHAGWGSREAMRKFLRENHPKRRSA